jgi:S-adenosylmethionine:tRNA ribosyltransferase-isomerase
MNTEDFDYDLPEALIAQKPLRVRDQCRLCTVDRSSGAVGHRRFSDIGDFLRPGDLLVLNNSRVVRARIPCRKEGSGGAVEVFLLEPPGAVAQRRFQVFFKPARKAISGSRLVPELAAEGGAFQVLAQGGEEPGLVEWMGPRALDAQALEALGVMPLPPYIKRPRIPEGRTGVLDSRFYQNIFAREDGSAAAPTAGLHFTQALLARLRLQGIAFAELTLHVGAGTFLPVKTTRLDEHRMHRERYALSQACIQAVQDAKARGGRVIAIGTTSARVLESAFGPDLQAKPGWAETSIFIRPGYTFKVLDGLITNFHQPKSTLLALVSAFYDRSRILNIYQSCVSKGYRFLSYGDAMFLI